MFTFIQYVACFVLLFLGLHLMAIISCWIEMVGALRSGDMVWPGPPVHETAWQPRTPEGLGEKRSYLIPAFAQDTLGVVWSILVMGIVALDVPGVIRNKSNPVLYAFFVFSALIAMMFMNNASNHRRQFFERTTIHQRSLPGRLISVLRELMGKSNNPTSWDFSSVIEAAMLLLRAG
jgi:hypothetical protein